MPTIDFWWSGRVLDLKNPHPGQFTLVDIASGLSKACRFGGHLQEFYSVAEHSILSAKQAELDGHSLDVQLACLFHDGAEGLLGGDVISPLKQLLPDYKKIEKAVMKAISLRFGIDFDTHYNTIKEIDTAMKFAERRRLLYRDNRHWTGEDRARIINPNIGPLDHKQAMTEFIYAANCLLSEIAATNEEKRDASRALEGNSG